MIRQAGLSQLPFSMGNGEQFVPQAGLAPPEPMAEAPVAPMAQPGAVASPMTLTMADRRNLIATMQQRGMSVPEIRAELTALGLVGSPVDTVEEAADEGRQGYGSVLYQGAKSLGQQSLEGAGALVDLAGAETAGQAISDAGEAVFGLTPAEQEAQQRAAAEGSFVKDVGDAVVGSLPTMAAAAAGSFAGGSYGLSIGGPWGAAIGGVVGGALAVLPQAVGSALQRAEENGEDPTDSVTQGKALAVGVGSALAERIVPGRLAAKFAGPIGEEAARMVSSGALRAAGKNAATEALTELAQNSLEIAVFDPKIYGSLTPEEIDEVMPYFVEKYGRESAVALLAGAGAGAGFGAVEGTVGQQKVNAQRALEVRTLQKAAEAGGLSADALQTASQDPSLVPIMAAGAKEVAAAQRDVQKFTAVLQTASESGDSEAIAEAQAKLAAATARAKTAYDSVIPKLGGLSSAQVDAREEMETQKARDVLVGDNLIDAERSLKLPPKDVRNLAKELTAAKSRLKTAQDAMNAPDMFDPEVRQKADEELRAARAGLERTQDTIKIKTGVETAADIRKRNEDKVETEAYNAAVDRQFERKFKPLIDKGDNQAAIAQAQEIIRTAEAGDPDKGLNAAIRKLETQLDKASTVKDIEALEKEIAAKRARLGRRAPIVAAARRLIDTLNPQQVGAVVQGSSPTTAGQSTAPEATPATATPVPAPVVTAVAPGTVQGLPIPPTTAPEPAKASAPPEAPTSAAPAPTGGASAPPVDTSSDDEAYQTALDYGRRKEITPPEIVQKIAPRIERDGYNARVANGLDPDATPTELWSVTGNTAQLKLERDLQNASGLGIDAKPSAVAVALRRKVSKQATDPEPEAKKDPEPEIEPVPDDIKAKDKEDADKAQARTDAAARAKARTKTDAQTAAKTDADVEATQARIDAQYQKDKAPEFEPSKRRAVGIPSNLRYIDMIDLFGRRTATLKQAREFVLEQAAKTGYEYMVSYDTKTGEVLSVGTVNRSNMAFASNEAYDRMKRGDAVTIVHNHPSGTSLSGPDLGAMYAYPGEVTVIAVARNGFVYTAKPTEKGRRYIGSIIDKKQASLRRRMFQSATKPFIANGLISVDRYGIPDSGDLLVLDRAISRAVNKAFALEGLLDYNESGEVGQLTRLEMEAYTQGVQDARKAIRDLLPLSARGPEGTAGGGSGGIQRPGTVRPRRPASRSKKGSDPGPAGSAVGEGEGGIVSFEETDFAKDYKRSEDLFDAQLPGAQKAIVVPDWLDVKTDNGRSYADMLDRAKNPGSTLKKALSAMERGLVNRMAPIRDLEIEQKGALGVGMDSAFKSAEIAINDSGRNESLMFYGAADLGPNGEFRVARGTIGIRKMLEKIGDGQKLVDWMSYMGARRAQEIRNKGLETPLTDKDIADGLALENPIFKEVAADWKRFNDANVDFLVKTGRISPALGATLKADAAYVPFYRSADMVDGTVDLMDDEDIKKQASIMIRSGGNLTARDPGIKKLVGGKDRKVNNLVTNMIHNSQAIVAAGMRNRAANMSFDMLTQAGYVETQPGRRETKDGEWINAPMPKHAVKMWRKGKMEYVVPTDIEALPVLLAMAGMQPVRLTGIARVMAQIGSFFRQSITLSPAFIIRNMIRDTVSTAVLMGGRNLTYNHLVGGTIRESLRHGTNRQAFTAMSGMGDFRFGGGDIGLGRNDLMIELGLQPKTIGSRFRKVIEKLEEYGTASELANRLATYETLLKEGVRADEAAYQALTLVNYSRKGSNEQLQTLLPLVPFLNARIQGLARIAEDFTTKRGPERRQAIMRLALNGSILSMFSALLWGWNNQDEERREKYEAEPLHRRLNYSIIYLGDMKVMIPKAFEIGTIFSTIPEFAMEAAINGETSEIGSATVQTLVNTFGFNPIPAAILPALEAVANYSFFTGQAIEGDRLEARLREDRINPQTSALAVALARSGLGDFTGLSPVMLEHLLAGYGGVAYQMLATTVDTVAGDLGLLPSRPEGVFGTIPVVTPVLENAIGSMVKFSEGDSANRWLEDFYATRNSITQLYRSAKDAALVGDVERARQLLAEAPATPQAYKLVNKVGARMGDLNAVIRQIRADPKMTPEAKRAKLKVLIEERNTMSREVMKIIREYEEKQGTTFRRAAA